jgi:A/G-specific adenine glycosylase
VAPAAPAPARVQRPAQVAARLETQLTSWYAANARDLPWRAADATPWGVLVSEVMLQQTPVARVLPVWAEWLERWPDPPALARAAPGAAIRHWGRLGYPRRALRLHEAAVAITEHHDGQVPSSYPDLLALRGIGTYTAAAVASFAFGRRRAVVDTNVRRVEARAVTGVALPAPALSAAESRLAEALLPSDDTRVARWNVAVMELGALVCTARSPRCGDCPVRAHCAWQRAGAPAYDGRPHPVQAWHGTDRQVRGRLLAALRATGRTLTRADLLTAGSNGSGSNGSGSNGSGSNSVDPQGAGPEQADRCLVALVADGLVQQVGADRYRLPE